MAYGRSAPFIDKLKGLIKPEDFADGIYSEVAKLVFEEYEKGGKVIPAKIISCFEMHRTTVTGGGYFKRRSS